MNDETIAFGIPVVGLFVGAVILVASLFVTGLGLVTALGGIVGLLSIAALALAVARTPSEEPSIGVSRRESREPRRTRGAK